MQKIRLDDFHFFFNLIICEKTVLHTHTLKLPSTWDNCNSIQSNIPALPEAGEWELRLTHVICHTGASDSCTQHKIQHVWVLGSRGQILLGQIYELLFLLSCIPGDPKHWEESGKLSSCPALLRLTLRGILRGDPPAELAIKPKNNYKIPGWMDYAFPNQQLRTASPLF